MLSTRGDCREELRGDASGADCRLCEVAGNSERASLLSCADSVVESEGGE